MGLGPGPSDTTSQLVWSRGRGQTRTRVLKIQLECAFWWGARSHKPEPCGRHPGSWLALETGPAGSVVRSPALLLTWLQGPQPLPSWAAVRLPEPQFPHRSRSRLRLSHSLRDQRVRACCSLAVGDMHRCLNVCCHSPWGPWAGLSGAWQGFPVKGQMTFQASQATYGLGDILLCDSLL